MSGELQNLDIFGLVTGGADFALKSQLVDVDLDGDRNAATGEQLNDAALMMFALSDLDLTVGFGGDGLQIDGGTLGLAVIKAPTPAAGAGTDNRSWVALSGHDLDFTLVLPGITADVDDVTLKINRASGQRTPPPTGTPPTPGVPVLATALNWATADATPLPAAVDLNPAGGWTTPSGLVDPGSILPTPVPLGITYRGELLAIAGKLTGISMFEGFVTGSADFEIESGIVAVDLPGTAPDPASPSLLRLGLSKAALTIGDPAGVNVSFSNASLALASLKAGTPATGSDTRQWLALKGTIGLATINGLPTELDLEVKSLTVEINRASGLHKTAANVETQAVALNWLTQLNLDKDATAGEATDDRLVIAGIPIDFTGDFLRASGRLDIDLFGFVQGSVAFAFQQQTVDVKIGSGAVFSGNLTTIALNILGDDGNAANGVENGLFIGTPDRSIGFSVASGSLAIAALKPTVADGRSWTAITAQIANGTFSGGAPLEATVNSLRVEINKAAGAGAQPLNWTSSIDTDGDHGSFTPDTVSISVETGGSRSSTRSPTRARSSAPRAR